MLCTICTPKFGQKNNPCAAGNGTRMKIENTIKNHLYCSIERKECQVHGQRKMCQLRDQRCTIASWNGWTAALRQLRRTADFGQAERYQKSGGTGT